MIRAFVALPVPPEVRSRLTVLQFLLPLPRQTDPDQFHLTLAFLDDVPDSVLAALDEGLSALRQAPFDLLLSGVGLFGGARPRAVWAGVAACEPLDRLQAKVERIARQAGAEIPAQKFRPHVTLGRFPPPPSEDAMRIERAVAGETGFRAGPWQVDAVVLYQSHLRRDGPVHDELARYPLA